MSIKLYNGTFRCVDLHCVYTGVVYYVFVCRFYSPFCVSTVIVITRRRRNGSGQLTAIWFPKKPLECLYTSCMHSGRHGRRIHPVYCIILLWRSCHVFSSVVSKWWCLSEYVAKTRVDLLWAWNNLVGRQYKNISTCNLCLPDFNNLILNYNFFFFYYYF